MIKKTIVLIALVLALSFSLVGSGHVLAVSGLTFQSGVQVVNLDPNNAANITLDYYRQADGVKEVTISDTIAKGASKTYFPITGIQAGFNGSLVISSDVPVVAIANTITSDSMYNDAMDSFSGGSTTFNLPLVMCSNSGNDTFFNVQNAGGSDANITIAYTPGSTGASGVTETATIKPGAAKTFDQSLGSTTKNCANLKDPTTNKFVGSATITSNMPVVATVMQVNTTTFKALLAYSGFSAGSTTVSVPLVMANNSGYYTGIQIQNVGGSATNVTVTYGPNVASGDHSYPPPADTCNALAAGKACTLIQNGGAWAGHKYVGSATITTNNSMPLVAIVNQVYGQTATAGPYGSSYSAFDPNAATSSAVMPLIMANNSTWFTGYQVMNVGTGACTIAVNYGPDTKTSDGIFAPVAEAFSLAIGASKTVLQSGTSPSNGSLNNWTAGFAKTYVGSADIVGTGAGCKVAAIVNEAAPGLGDKLLSYTAFSH